MKEPEEHPISQYQWGRVLLLDSLIQDFYLLLRLNHKETMQECFERLSKFYDIPTENSSLNNDNYIEKAGYYTSRISYEK